MNIHQLNAGGLPRTKITEIKKTVNEESTAVLITNEANVRKESIKFYTMNGYTIYALYKSRQIASGIVAAVKTTLTSKFRITKEINEADTKETCIHVRCLGRALSSCNLSFLQTYRFLITNRNTVYLLVMLWDTHICNRFRLYKVCK